MPTAVIDVDGCCADLNTEWVRRCERATGTTIVVDKPDMRDCVVAEHRERILEHLQEVDLYENVRPVVGALEGVNTLRDLGFEIVFATLCMFGMVDQKARWMVREGFTACDNTHYSDRPEMFLPSEFIAVTRKELIGGDLLIEDNMAHATRWLSAHGGVCALIDYPYNRQTPRPPRSRGHLMRVPTPPNAWTAIIPLAQKLVR